ncbi:MAG TPA: AbrB/MazE/SpoVT family DNA-binding domain-containing protein [Gaiella sp.]|nr:AbrB/MazE/SpoVT family DNA-binding domain-containing protein [Gaiella sp.]
MSDTFRVRIGPKGRLVVPVELRRELALEEGTEAVARAEDGRLVVERRDVVLRRLREAVARSVGREVSLVDELIAGRREEARREEG